jgi:hypothetical protein
MSKSPDPGGNRGASLGGLEVTPDRRKREAKRRKRQEQAWAAKAGPVTVAFDPSLVKPPTDTSRRMRF